MEWKYVLEMGDSMIRVVIVEDDPMVLEVNKGFLKKTPKFSLVGTATTGKAALKIIKEKKPDLVLLDVYLPDISGMEVLYTLRAEELPVDVIMITAAKDAKTVQNMVRYGAVDYLVKPFNYERFRRALDNYAKMWNKFNKDQVISQEDIDDLKDKNDGQPAQEALPKGLSEITLKQVMDAVSSKKKPVTAEELAADLGMARVTVRRYLSYLKKTNQIKMQVEYGKVGRPSNYYFV